MVGGDVATLVSNAAYPGCLKEPSFAFILNTCRCKRC
jgi:hypothetical protein